MRKTIITKLFLLLGGILFSLVITSCSINDIKQEGFFFDLKEAYHLGKLNREDLLEIAHYHNNGLEHSDSLEENTKIKIKNTRLLELKNSNVSIDEKVPVIDDVNIVKYYGMYNDCYVIMITDNFTDFLEVLCNDNIANVEFNYSNSNKILVWSEKNMNNDEKIKYEYAQAYLLKKYPFATINDVCIEKKLGIYDNAHVLFITNNYEEYTTVVTKETILNYVFEYSNNNSALVFFENSFYTLKEAYKMKILSDDSLNEIFKHFPIPSGGGMEINGEPIT